MSKCKPYPKYKDSGVEWIGEIPEKWNSTEIRWTFQRVKVTNCPTETLLSVYRDHGVIPKNSRDDNWNKESDDLSAYQLVCEGDLVINKMKAWQGSIAISLFRGIVSPAYFVYKSIHNEQNTFFHYLLRSKPYILHYGIISKGIRVNQWDLEHEAFRLTPILLPAKKEQQDISEYLDQETSLIDALITKKTRSIELLREKRQAMITHVVTKGLNPNVKMKDSGVEWIGEVPVDWNIKSIRHCSNIMRGKFSHRPRNDPSFYDGDYPFIQTGDITSVTRYITTFSQTLNDKGTTVSKEFPKGTLVMAIAANIGDVAILNFPAYFPDSIVGFFPDELTDLNFLFYYISAIKKHLYLYATISTQLNINVDQISAIPMVCSTIAEQKTIVTYLDKKCDAIDSIITKTERSIELLKEKRQALITAAVTGKIDVREAV